MKQFIFGSMALGLLLNTMPVQAQSMQTPGTKVPSYGDTPSSASEGTTTDGTVKTSPQAANNQRIDGQDPTNGRELPYYKTHGRGGKYLGLRP